MVQIKTRHKVVINAAHQDIQVLMPSKELTRLVHGGVEEYNMKSKAVQCVRSG